MSVTRHLPSALALVAALALGVSGCGGDAEQVDAAPSASASTSARTTIAPSTVPSASATSQAPGATASASPSTSAAPSATPSDSATVAPSASPSASGEPVSEGEGGTSPRDPVSGPATVTDYAVKLSSGDVCQIFDGAVNCFFADQSVSPSCSGDTPMGHVSFDGNAVAVGCWSEGDAALIPTLNPGEVLADPEGTFVCEALAGGSPGLRCSDAATGRSAVLAADQATVQN